MVTETITKESLKAVEYFEAKLNFESTPYGLKSAIEKGEKLQIIDLRTPELFAEGHVPGAVNVDAQQLEKYLPKLDPAATTVVYCYNLLCSLGTNSALLLAKHGYNVKELTGGWEGWAKLLMPAEKGTKASSCATSEGHACG